MPAGIFLNEKKPLLSVVVPKEVFESRMLTNSNGLPFEITLPEIEAVCAKVMELMKTKTNNVNAFFIYNEFEAKVYVKMISQIKKIRLT